MFEIKKEAQNINLIFTKEHKRIIDDAFKSYKHFGLNNNSLGRSLSRVFYPYIPKTNIEKFEHYPAYIPASRSYINLLPVFLERSYLDSLSDKPSAIVDPFLISFKKYLDTYQRFYDHHKSTDKENSKFENMCEALLNGHVIENEKFKKYILHEDGRMIETSLASSAQQELLPLLNALRVTGERGGDFSFFIEEPEAHLFPSAQKKLMELIAFYCNMRQEQPQIFITTHSPYILTSLNNLLLAFQALKKPECGKDVHEKYKDIALDAENFSAYYIGDGTARNLMEDGLILADGIDDVSEEIGKEFDTLLDVLYKNEDVE